MAGRGSFIESFPLFGYDLDDYDELFAEKLELLLASARDRAGHLVGHAPRVARRPRRLPAPGAGAAAGVDRGRRHARVGVPRRARSGCRWRSRSSAAQPSGSRRSSSSTAAPRPRPATSRRRLSINSHGYVAETSAAGRRRVLPGLRRDDEPRSAASAAGRRLTRQDFDALRTRRGALVVGSPDEVVEKILFQHELFGHQRFLAQMSVGSMPHEQVLRSIELFGTEVAPAVRAEVATAARRERARRCSTGSGASSSCTPTSAPTATPERAWRRWRDVRDELFRAHLAVAAARARRRAAFGGVPLYHYDPALRVLGDRRGGRPRAARDRDLR